MGVPRWAAALAAAKIPGVESSRMIELETLVLAALASVSELVPAPERIVVDRYSAWAKEGGDVGTYPGAIGVCSIVEP